MPDLAIEMLSPSTARRDCTEKKEIYARNRVREYWLVDPRANRVTVLGLGAHGFEDARVFEAGRIGSDVRADLRITVEEALAR